MTALEIAVTSAAGAVTATRAGADRVELCTGLELGGLTPSSGLVESAVNTGAAVHALIRPRPGGFAYSPDELAPAVRDCAAIAGMGVAGVVIGVLTSHGRVDVDAVQRLRGAALDVNPDLEVTFHRAIDVVADPLAALVDLLPLGLTRVLTSGGADRVRDGVEAIAAMTECSAGRIQIMAGGGLRPGDIRHVVAETRIDAVHLSAKRQVAADMPGTVALGALDDGSGGHFVTDESVVRAAADEVALVS